MVDILEKMREEIQEEVKSQAYGYTPGLKRKPKDNKYQDYLSLCLKKINPNDPESYSHIEIIEGKEMYPNEQMRACGLWWRKDRTASKPKELLKSRFESEVQKGKTIVSMEERKKLGDVE